MGTNTVYADEKPDLDARLNPDIEDLLEEGAVLWALPELLENWGAVRLRAALAPDEKIALCFATDMALGGQYAPELLAVSGSRALVVGPEQEDIVRELPLEAVQQVAVKQSMGNGFLLLTTTDANVRMLRFSASLSDEADELRDRLLEHLRATQSDAELEDTSPEEDPANGEMGTEAANRDTRPRCSVCGQLLPRGMETCTACLERHALLARLLSYLKPFKALVVVTVSLTALMALIQVAVPRMVRDIINKAVMPRDRSMLALLVGIVAVLFALRAALSAVRRILNARLAQDVIYDLREAVYSHLQRLR